MQSLANDVSDTYERIAPRAFKNQVMQTFRCLAVWGTDDFCGQFHSQRLNKEHFDSFFFNICLFFHYINFFLIWCGILT